MTSTSLHAAMAMALSSWTIAVEAVVDDGAVSYRATARRQRSTMDHSLVTVTVMTTRHKSPGAALRFLRGVMLGGGHLVSAEVSRLERVTP
jgi:hypothetical protein